MHAIEVKISCLEERKHTMFDILWHPLMIVVMSLKRFDSLWTCLLNAFKWKVNIFLNSFWFLVVYFIIQCHHINCIPTNDEMYVIVALKGGSDDWKNTHWYIHCHFDNVEWSWTWHWPLPPNWLNGGKWNGTWFLTTCVHTSWNNILSGSTSNFGTWSMLKLIQQGLGCHIQKRK
jgi:hypothetical protein